jgi:hypothetical protein
MAIHSFELDQLLTLQVPELVVWLSGVSVSDGITFPSKPNFVQSHLSIKSEFVILMGLVWLALASHHAMAILLFELNKLLTLPVPVPELVIWFDRSFGAVIFPSKSDFVQSSHSTRSKFVILT